MRLIPAIDLKAGHCVQTAARAISRPKRATDAEPRALLAKYRESRRRLAARRRPRRRARRQQRQPRHHRRPRRARAPSSCKWAAACATPPPVAQMLDLGVARVVVGSAALIKADQVRSLAQVLRPRAHRRWLSTCGWTRRARRASPRMAGASNRSSRCGTRSASFANPTSGTCCAPT